MTRSNARNILRRASRKGLRWVGDQGYTWFVANLVSAALRLREDAAKGIGRQWAAEAESLLGDVYDLQFSASKAAASAYRRALRWDPKHAWAQDELGRALHHGGDYIAAKRAWKKALLLSPGNDYILRDLKELEKDIRYRRTPFAPPDDRLVQASELLAGLKPANALQLVARTATVEGAQMRARAYAAMGNVEAYFREWERIAAMRGEVVMSDDDWFFLPDDVWNHPRFWKATLAIGTRWGSGTYPRDESFPDPKRWPRYDSKASLLRFHRRWRLLSKLHLARTERDERSLRDLCRRYPTWTYARSVLKSVSGRH